MADINISQLDVREGEEILLTLIYPKRIEDMTPDQVAEFSLAAGEQAEFSASVGRRVKKETVGDVSVTYGEDDIRAFDVHGASISPAAISRLQRCGLLCRWI